MLDRERDTEPTRLGKYRKMCVWKKNAAGINISAFNEHTERIRAKLGGLCFHYVARYIHLL